jgi:hypothetical protein
MSYFWQGPMPLGWWIEYYGARSIEASRRAARRAQQMELI